MTEHLNNKIKELYINTPNGISVSYGFKQVGGVYTTEQCIVFGAVKKLPLSEIPENEILPSTVEVNGVIYNTDVVETGVISLLVCNNSSTNPCFSYGYPPNAYNKLTPNSQLQRPLLGGSSIESVGGGTLGFIAKHTATGKLVGVTNSHVLYQDVDNFRSIDFSPENVPTNNPGVGYNIGQPWQSTANGSLIGKFLYIKRWIRDPFYNQIDAGLISLTQYDSLNRPVITSDSWKQVGLDIGTTAPPFATTYELDNLLNYPNLEVSSSGLTTGPKQGTCGLRISAIHAMSALTIGTQVEDTITITRIDPTCNYPTASGDSGSCVLAKINGVWKIIGLVFSGSDTQASVCRIDYIATQLGIEAWDGTITSTSFIDPTSIQTITTAGVSTQDSITINGKEYRQSLPTTNAPTV